MKCANHSCSPTTNPRGKCFSNFPHGPGRSNGSNSSCRFSFQWCWMRSWSCARYTATGRHKWSRKFACSRQSCPIQSENCDGNVANVSHCSAIMWKWGAIDWRVPHVLQLFRAVFHTSSPHCNRCYRWSPSKMVDLDGHAVRTQTRTGRAGRASSWTCWARFSWKTIRSHRCGPMRLSFRNIQVRWKGITGTHRHTYASFWLHSNGIVLATRHLFRRNGMNNLNANDWNG